MINNNSIPKSESDLLINKWEYDLLEEYSKLINTADFTSAKFVLDIATGSGRAASLITRLGVMVFTGDYNNNQKFNSEKRITNNYLKLVKYIRLNLEKIPFRDGSIDNIVCINTFHELDNPINCINEIMRIYSSKGKLLIADFNSDGFNVMDKLHTHKYGRLHPRGHISSEEIKEILSEKYSYIKEINTKLNIGFIVSGIRNES
ncbi:MAG: class I SAM-dependent methyltransferase [Bacteroidetes bacterium]|nr:class I SAM-dependent methyltransferase [Bacteroidota bacterium]